MMVSRKKRRRPKLDENYNPAELDWPATEAFLARMRNRPRIGAPRPNRWFLGITLLLQSAWVLFLLTMALSR